MLRQKPVRILQKPPEEKAKEKVGKRWAPKLKICWVVATQIFGDTLGIPLKYWWFNRDPYN